MKFRVFWNVAPCSHFEVDRCFRDEYCLHHQGDEGAVSTSETPVNFEVTTWRYIPENSTLQLKKQKNKKLVCRVTVMSSKLTNTVVE
jgi:hypothetical protein